jgi:hypothetical protein
MTRTCGVSIITPAHNAASTIDRTIESVLAQTHSHWEQIVVDDGSVDETSHVVSQHVRYDARIRLIRQAQAGEAGARNTGLELARHEWLLFLDADDWVAADYLEAALSTLRSDDSCDAVVCRSARVARDGTVVVQQRDLPRGDLFPLLARYPPFDIHACVVRRAVVASVGGFDTTLDRGPDWDLWQRVARTGVRFAAMDRVYAFYRMSPSGVSLDAERVLRGSLVILRRGHAPDSRVPNPSPLHANGMPPDQVASQVFYSLSWCAGLLLGTGRDPRPLLKLVRDEHFPDLWPPAVADCILEAAPLPTCSAPHQWRDLVGRFMPPLYPFLLALEGQARAPDLARRAHAEIVARVDRLVRAGEAA